MSDPNDMSSLLNIDEPGEQTPPAADPGADDGTPKPTDVEKRMSDLEESNKNLTEQVRQTSETNKGLSAFHDKIVGSSDEEKDKQKKQELLKALDEDAIETINGMIADGIAGTEKKVSLVDKTATAHRSMQAVDKDYDVDWGKDHQKVIDKLKTFSKESKDSDPAGTLLDACRLAGVIKPKDKSTPPPVAAKGRGGGVPTPADKTEEDETNKRFNTYSSNKSKNIFGIKDKAKK